MITAMPPKAVNFGFEVSMKRNHEDCFSETSQAVLQKPKRTQRLASISIEKMLGILKEHQVHTRNGTTSIIGGATLKFHNGVDVSISLTFDRMRSRLSLQARHTSQNSRASASFAGAMAMYGARSLSIA